MYVKRSGQKMREGDEQMSKNILITGAKMVLPNGTIEGDLRITDGIISEILPEGNLQPNDEEFVYDATGMYLLPGGIDPQVHFREPGHEFKEDLQSGSAAAASGGITSFLDMPNNNPAATTIESMQSKIDSAQKKCITNFGFFIGATPDNVKQLQLAVGKPGEGVSIPGICGIKIFMGSSTGDLLVHETEHLRNIFENTAGLIAVHAEDENRLNERFELFKDRNDIAAHVEWRDDVCALNATKLAVSIAQETGHRLHILHLTSGIEADFLSQLEPNHRITSETLPQHLTFDETDVLERDVRLKMNPPIRYSKDKETLWQRLLDGTIQCIATDHAPHLLEDKSKGWPNAPSGMPGVETSLPMMLTHAKSGLCTIEQVANWMSTNVAECYQMVGKGSLNVGMDGDVVVVDMDTIRTVNDSNSWTRVGWNPFHGIELVGWPVLTVVNGVPVFERNEGTGDKGMVLVEPGSVGNPLVMMPWD
jgi:dihydroorotase